MEVAWGVYGISMQATPPRGSGAEQGSGDGVVGRMSGAVTSEQPMFEIGGMALSCALSPSLSIYIYTHTYNTYAFTYTYIYIYTCR